MFLRYCKVLPSVGKKTTPNNCFDLGKPSSAEHRTFIFSGVQVPTSGQALVEPVSGLLRFGVNRGMYMIVYDSS